VVCVLSPVVGKRIHISAVRHIHDMVIFFLTAADFVCRTSSIGNALEGLKVINTKSHSFKVNMLGRIWYLL